MNRLNKRLFWLMLPFLLVACQSYKKVPYLQDVEVIEQTAQQDKMYDAKIMPKDLLTIVVSCTSPELAMPFNLTIASQVNVNEMSKYTTAQPTLQTYLVSNEGTIDFPDIRRTEVRWIDEETGRANDCRKAETLYKGDSNCNSTYGELQNFCHWRGCPPGHIHN